MTGNAADDWTEPSLEIRTAHADEVAALLELAAADAAGAAPVPWQWELASGESAGSTEPGGLLEPDLVPDQEDEPILCYWDLEDEASAELVALAQRDAGRVTALEEEAVDGAAEPPGIEKPPGGSAPVDAPPVRSAGSSRHWHAWRGAAIAVFLASTVVVVAFAMRAYREAAPATPALVARAMLSARALEPLESRLAAVDEPAGGAVEPEEDERLSAAAADPERTGLMAAPSSHRRAPAASGPEPANRSGSSSGLPASGLAVAHPLGRPGATASHRRAIPPPAAVPSDEELPPESDDFRWYQRRPKVAARTTEWQTPATALGANRIAPPRRNRRATVRR